MIVKRKDGFYVVSEKGKNLGGPYKGRDKAKKRLAQVEAFKHMNINKALDKAEVKYIILEKAKKQFYKKLIVTYASGKIKVWLVDGKYIRTNIDIDFTTGGNPKVYKYIPLDEIWIDDQIHPDEINFDIFHEMYESLMIVKGKSYNKAHGNTNKLELKFRKQGSVPTNVLTKLGERLAEECDNI